MTQATKATPTKHRIATPVWMRRSDLRQAFIERMFPNREENDRQREQAERWETVIDGYFLQALPRNEIAAELACSIPTVASIIQHIRRAAAAGPTKPGLRQDGRPHTGKRKGRPRKPGARRTPKRQPKPPSIPIPLSTGPESGFENDDEEWGEESEQT